MPALTLRCPQCPDIQQGTSVPLDRLKRMLESGEEVTVMDSQCGHIWSLSEGEIQGIRKALTEGKL